MFEFNVSPQDLGAYSLTTPFVIEYLGQPYFFFAVSMDGNQRDRNYTIWAHTPGWQEPRQVLQYQASLCGPWIVSIDTGFRMYVAVLAQEQHVYSIVTFLSNNLIDWQFEGVTMEGFEFYQSVTCPCVLRDRWMMFHTEENDTFYSFSNDGKQFTREGTLAIERDVDSIRGQIKPNIFSIGPLQWLMFLSGLRADGTFCTMVYRSTNLLTWEKRGTIPPSDGQSSLYKPVLYQNNLIAVVKDLDKRGYIRSITVDPLALWDGIMPLDTYTI